mgnify:FL=1
MASLNSLYFKKETLEILLKTVNAKNEKGVEITVSINDDTNNYGQNISAYVAQSKEQREAKKQRFFVANGKTFWTDGSIKVAERKDAVNAHTEQQPTQEEVDLPF